MFYQIMEMTKYILRVLEHEGEETEDALTRLYFRLLHDEGYEYGLWKEDILPSSKKDCEKRGKYAKKLRKYEETRKKWEAMDSISKKAKIHRGRKPTEPHNRTVQRYQQLLRHSCGIQFINDRGRREDGKHYYKARPDVIDAFIKRYALSSEEFERLKLEAEDLRHKFASSSIKPGMGRFGRFDIYLHSQGKSLDFKRTVRTYFEFGDGFRRTERRLPVTVLGPLSDIPDYDGKSMTIHVEDENTELVSSSKITDSLFLTWFDLDLLLEDGLPLTDKEKRWVLDWFFLHLRMWEEHRLEMGMEKKGQHPPLIDLEFIENTKGHFLKEFKGWEKKLREVSKDDWLDWFLKKREGNKVVPSI